MSCCEIAFKPIGVIHSELVEMERKPVSPVQARYRRGIAEIFAEYASYLNDLGKFSYLYLIYRDSSSAHCDTEKSRPSMNGIGLSLVELVLWQGNMLHLRGVDIQDGTFIIDIKPCLARPDHVSAAHDSWHGQVNERVARQLIKYGCSA